MLSELDDCIPDNRRGVEEIIEATELGDHINQFLSTLDTGDCGLFVSRYFYVMTIDQLALKYSCSSRQVKYRLEKIRSMLNTYLTKEGFR